MRWVLIAAALVLPLHAQEKSGSGLSEENEKQLERDKILITSRTYQQIYTPYTGGGGEFITSDTVIAAWNMLLGQSLAVIDKRCAESLPGDLEAAYSALPTEVIKDINLADFDAARRKARLILGVALKLSNSSWQGGEELEGLIAAEVKKIESAEGTLLPAWLTLGEAQALRSFDYGTFKPVAAYAGDERMEKYYRTVRWLQYASLAPNNTVNQIAWKLLADATRTKSSFDLLARTTEVLFGPTEGEEKEFMRLSVIEPGKGLDVRLFEKSTSPQRQWPDPVEVMALAGMPMAQKMVSSEPAVTKGVGELSRSWSWWPGPVSSSYLGAMSALSDTTGDDLPSFMKSEAWQRKCLNTGLAGWAQMSRATALNRQTAMSAFGSADKPPRSFVEPNPEFFHRFAAMTSNTVFGLRSVKYHFGPSKASEGIGEVPTDFELEMILYRWENLKDLCHDLEYLANKQLRGIEPAATDQQFLEGFGGRLEGSMRHGKEEKDDAPQVAVAYSRPGVGMLLVGTGRPQQILVRYPWKGKEYVCHGAVLPFRSMQTDRVLTDSEWKERLDGPQAPEAPEWLKPILAK